MGCKEYKLSRRTMMGATGASVLGLSIRDLLAYAGKDHAARAEHVILFWNGWRNVPHRHLGSQARASQPRGNLIPSQLRFLAFRFPRSFHNWPSRCIMRP